MKEKKKRTEIAKFRCASCSSILSLFSSPSFSSRCHETKRNLHDLILRLEKCYNFATICCQNGFLFSDDTKQKFAPFFTYTYVRISKKMRDHRLFVKLLFSSKLIVRELNVFTLFIYFILFSLIDRNNDAPSPTIGVSRRLILFLNDDDRSKNRSDTEYSVLC